MSTTISSENLEAAVLFGLKGKIALVTGGGTGMYVDIFYPPMPDTCQY